jgi:hypothetical protein
MTLPKLAALLPLAAFAACGTKVVDLAPTNDADANDAAGNRDAPFPSPFCIEIMARSPDGTTPCLACYDEWGQPTKKTCTDPGSGQNTIPGEECKISTDDRALLGMNNVRCWSCGMRRYCLSCREPSPSNGCRSCWWNHDPATLCQQCFTSGKVSKDECDRLLPDLKTPAGT